MSSRLQDKRNINTNVNTYSLLLLAFDANVKEPRAHTAMVWAMEHALKRGDTLVIVVVCASVRGPLGYRVKIGDEKWQSANSALLKLEIQQKVELWTAFPELQDRCIGGGMELLLAVKAAQRPEVAIVREAVTLGATHVVLDKSLKNRRLEFYVENLSCRVTRMRKSRGVEVVRQAKVVENHRPSPSPNDLGLQPKRTSTSRSAPSTGTSSTQSRCSSTVSQPVTTSTEDDDDDDLFSIGSPQHDTEFTDSILRNTRSLDGSDDPSVTITAASSHEPLSPAFIARLTCVVGLGECAEVHLRGPLRDGEGLLVGASPAALFLLHQGNRSSGVTTIGAPASYIAMEGGLLMRLAHLESDQRVLAVDASGRTRTVAVGHAITRPQPLVLVEASDGSEARRHSVILHHSQSVCLSGDAKLLSVKRLQVGDKVLLRLKSLHHPNF